MNQMAVLLFANLLKEKQSTENSKKHILFLLNNPGFEWPQRKKPFENNAEIDENADFQHFLCF